MEMQRIRMLFHYVLTNGGSVSSRWYFHQMGEKYWGEPMMVFSMFMIENATKGL
jgi:hypothetical protein